VPGWEWVGAILPPILVACIAISWDDFRFISRSILISQYKHFCISRYVQIYWTFFQQIFKSAFIVKIIKMLVTQWFFRPNFIGVFDIQLLQTNLPFEFWYCRKYWLKLHTRLEGSIVFHMGGMLEFSKMQKNKENVCRHSGLSFLGYLITIF
jgi:hypothetical protein